MRLPAGRPAVAPGIMVVDCASQVIRIAAESHGIALLVSIIRCRSAGKRYNAASIIRQ